MPAWTQVAPSVAPAFALYGLDDFGLPSSRRSTQSASSRLTSPSPPACTTPSRPNNARGGGGQLWDIALNRLTSSAGVPRFNDEFAGSTFSPDGHTLFANIQASRGMSFAIWGP
jgi:hypothetical protein